MAERKSTGGAGRSFEFTRTVRKPDMRPRHWWVWWFENDRWHRFVATMPEGACASYVDTARRYSAAVALEAA